jgi:peptidoglycan/xylan/chitin deacetylase (PgdA/CDA1 family)
MSRDGLLVLTYHAIDHRGGPIATDPAWFAATLAALTDAGFQTVDLDDWIAQGRPVIERGFALTFDDGLCSVLRAAEVVARHGFRATAFLVTDRMGADNAWPGQPRGVARRRLISWRDLADLRAAGFRFGAHTKTHPWLDRCDEATLDDELRGSRNEIEQRLGEPCRLLAYPYGAAKARVRAAAARHFEAAFSTRLDQARRSEDRYFLSRIDAYYLKSPRALDALISGRMARWLRWRRAWRGARAAVAMV